MVVQVARMYHEQNLSQATIAERLNVSQSRVSRWLKVAAASGIVRTIVISPEGVFPELEDEIRSRYGLRNILVVDSDEDESHILSVLGGAAASYLEKSLTGKDRVGISSWSETLMSAVDAMTPMKKQRAATVVQIMGGVGKPDVQVKATRVTARMAYMTGANAKLLPTPGIVATRSGRDALYQDPGVAETVAEWKRLTMVLVGIGSVAPSPLLRSSGNSISDVEMEHLRELGAVGDVAMRFFDAEGRLVESELNERVLGIGVDELRGIERRVGVAGGLRKFDAIQAAIRGGWVNVLITDVHTARRLVDDDQKPHAS